MYAKQHLGSVHCTGYHNLILGKSKKSKSKSAQKAEASEAENPESATNASAAEVEVAEPREYDQKLVQQLFVRHGECFTLFMYLLRAHTLTDRAVLKVRLEFARITVHIFGNFATCVFLKFIYFSFYVHIAFFDSNRINVC